MGSRMMAHQCWGLPLARMLANGFDLRPYGADDVFQLGRASAEQLRPVGKFPLLVYIDPGRVSGRPLWQSIGHTCLLFPGIWNLIWGARVRSTAGPSPHALQARPSSNALAFWVVILLHQDQALITCNRGAQRYIKRETVRTTKEEPMNWQCVRVPGRRSAAAWMALARAEH